MKKAILYIRVSTDEQAERGHSLAYQEDKLLKYCALKNIEVVKLFKEDHSAKTFERPQFNELLQYIKKNKGSANLLLFIKWDRFSRNTGDAYGMISTLNKINIEPQAIEQPLDLNIPENKIMLAFYLASPEVENDRRALNVIAGMRRARKDGRFLGKAPYGYLNKRDEQDKPILIPDPIGAPLVKEAFEEIAKGIKPVAHVYQELKLKGFKPSKNSFWTILINPLYYGGLLVSSYKDEISEVVKGKHPAIISKELYESVQDVLYNRKRPNYNFKTKNDELPLRGSLICKQCGGLITGSGSKNRLKNTYYYYHCQHGCKERFRAEKANEWILDELKNLIPNDEFVSLMKQVSNDIFRINGESKKAEIEKKKFEIEKIQSRLTNAQQLLLDGKIEVDDYKEMKAKFEPEMLKVKQDLALYKSSDENMAIYLEHTLDMLQNLDKLFIDADLSLKTTLLCSIFPEKLIFDENNYRTQKTNEAVSLLFKLGGDFKDKKNGLFRVKSRKSSCVTRPGFEPRLTVPKTAVLPLHHQAIKAANIECDLKINKLLL